MHTRPAARAAVVAEDVYMSQIDGPTHTTETRHTHHDRTMRLPLIRPSQSLPQLKRLGLTIT
eukprot:54827-Eustigmatos_ZCMA.PRE.1